MDKKILKDTALGGLVNNPVFILVLGMCPVIATSSTITNAFALGAATAFVLICSNILVSLFRKVIPDKVRLPAYLIIISTFATVVQMFIAGVLPAINESIGAFIPLIAVNCIILGRAEAFASKHSVGYSALDGLSMGLGFLVSISLLGAVRQFLAFIGLKVFATTAGGFIVLGLLMALFNFILTVYNKKKKQKLLQGVK